jgi:hypothetical protein
MGWTVRGFEHRWGQRIISFPYPPRPALAPTETLLRWIKLKIKFTVEEATKVQKGSRVIALFFP